MNRIIGLLLWAARDARRRPGTTLLSSAGLAILVALVGALIATAEALENTAAQILETAPSLVIRRIDGGGWAPMPTLAAERVRHIIGVTRVEIRTFGSVATPNRTATLHGVSPGTPLSGVPSSPNDDEALLGPGLQADKSDRITLKGAVTRSLRVVGAWEDDTAMVTQDIVITTTATAREILGIPEDHGSDLAAWVHQEDEAEAMIPDIQHALEFPVAITTRDEALGRSASMVAGRTGFSMLFFLPALIGLALLVVGSIRERIASKGEVGLLKAMGWTAHDIAVCQLFRAALIGAPGVMLGIAVAFLSVALPGLTWPLTLFFGWDAPPPGLSLSIEGSLITLAVVGGGVLVPWLTAAAVPVWQGSTADPADLLEAG